MDCPVCENPDTLPCYRMGDRFFETTREEFTLNRCPSCGLLFLEEGLVEKQLKDFYPPGYWWSEQGPYGKLERRYREWMVSSDQLRFVSRVLQPLAGLQLLDIGCGSGTFVRMARRAGVEADFGRNCSKSHSLIFPFTMGKNRNKRNKCSGCSKRSGYPWW